MGIKDPTKRFSDRAEYYASSRPSYPMEIISLLKKRASFDKRKIVADIGSGTGLLSGLFLKNGNEVYAVEPNTNMRKIAEKDLSHYGNFHSVGGRAEDTGLKGGSIDLISVGQAFHWFDLAPTKKEFKRILKKGGYVMLAYYEKNNAATRISKDYNTLISRYGRDFAKANGLHLSGQKGLSEFFGDGNFKKFVFPRGTTKRLTLKGLVDRLLSASYMPSKLELSYPAMINDIKKIFEKHQRNGRVTIVYTVTVYLGHF